MNPCPCKGVAICPTHIDHFAPAYSVKRLVVSLVIFVVIKVICLVLLSKGFIVIILAIGSRLVKVQIRLASCLALLEGHGFIMFASV